MMPIAVSAATASEDLAALVEAIKGINNVLKMRTIQTITCLI